MRKNFLLWRVVLVVAFFTLLGGALSCAPVKTGPRVWIDWPRDGHQVQAGTPLTVICHAYARDGVAEVQLGVNGEPYQLVAPVQAGEQFVEISLEWVATEPGDYLLSLTSFDMTGEASIPASVSVTVPGEAPGLILTPTYITPTMPSPETPLPPTQAPLPPTATPPPPTATSPPPTATSPPPTGTPERPTATPPPAPPAVVSFTANPPSVELGQCTTVSWAVEGVISSVWLDGEGVGDHDSRQKCPQATTTYTLRAVGPGGEKTATMQVPVTEPPTHTPSPPPDTEGPPAPSPVSPTGNEEVGCGAVTLRWNPVSDPSGINMYYVKVEKVTGTHKSGAWTTTDTELSISAAWIECGFEYRWAVAAEDGKGNMGPWSGWAEFAVTIT